MTTDTSAATKAGSHRGPRESVASRESPCETGSPLIDMNVLKKVRREDDLHSILTTRVRQHCPVCCLDMELNITWIIGRSRGVGNWILNGIYCDFPGVFGVFWLGSFKPKLVTA